MLLSTEVRRAEIVLLALQFITAVVGIWLLGRTSPAIEKILAENVVTLEAVQQMQRGLNEARADPEAGRSRFEQAHQRAMDNITEPPEEAVLATIETKAQATFARGKAPGPELSDALAKLAAINRDSMDRAHTEAQAVASAGAWSLVGLALLTVLVSIVFVRRTNDRIVAPVHHLHEVSTAYERGETHRRCEKFGMPDELRFVAETMNRLFDAELRRKRTDRRRARREEGLSLSPEGLTAMLTAIPDALVLLDRDGAPLASTEQATPRLRELVTGAVRLGAKSRAKEESKSHAKNTPDEPAPDAQATLEPEAREAAEEDIELRELPGGLFLIVQK